MEKFIGKAGMVLITWMVGTGWLWSESIPQDSWQPNGMSMADQTFAGGEVSNPSKSIKLHIGTKLSSTKKKRAKTSKKFNSKRSKSRKSARNSKSGIAINIPLKM